MIEKIAVIFLLIFGFLCLNSGVFADEPDDYDLIPRHIASDKVVEIKKIGSIVWIVFIDENGAPVNYFYNEFGAEDRRASPDNQGRITIGRFYETGEEVRESDEEPLGALEQKLFKKKFHDYGYGDGMHWRRAKEPTDFSDWLYVFQESMNEKYWRKRFVYFSDGSAEEIASFGEVLGGCLLSRARLIFEDSIPKEVHDAAIEWLEFAVNQKSLFSLKSDIWRVQSISESLADEEKKKELEIWLKGALVRSWASEEAKVKSEEVILAVLAELR